MAVIGYDPESGCLTVCPESAAWATKARLEQSRIITAANASADRTIVRGLRILPPGSVPAPGRDNGAHRPRRRPSGR
ncbi:DciA family protein [Streptomyces sp. NPDC101776]|uniref:DciA family protein n=1 Tax=Streptomyces sp. NPDC101776 TaxID=3366146 RepID=UPI00382A97D5